MDCCDLPEIDTNSLKVREMNLRTKIDRRSVLHGGGLVALAYASGTTLAQADNIADKRPDPKTLQTGDFIWPKRPGEFVPYNSGTVSPYDVEKMLWLEERRRFIDKVRADQRSPLSLRQLATDLEGMDFSEFIALYQADSSPGSPREYGGGASVLYVGHVGIIAFDGSTPTVIEAVWGKGVQQIPYDAWLKGREGAWVWHGRIFNRSNSDRANIAEAASKYVGKPYNFWNFDLADPASFYCSKLCWLAVRDALTFPIDDNSEPRRGFWFSPKQMLKARRIEKLFSPGSYTL